MHAEIINFLKEGNMKNLDIYFPNLNKDEFTELFKLKQFIRKYPRQVERWLKRGYMSGISIKHLFPLKPHFCKCQAKYKFEHQWLAHILNSPKSFMPLGSVIHDPKYLLSSLHMCVKIGVNIKFNINITFHRISTQYINNYVHGDSLLIYDGKDKRGQKCAHSIISGDIHFPWSFYTVTNVAAIQYYSSKTGVFPSNYEYFLHLTYQVMDKKIIESYTAAYASNSYKRYSNDLQICAHLLDKSGGYTIKYRLLLAVCNQKQSLGTTQWLLTVDRLKKVQVIVIEHNIQRLSLILHDGPGELSTTLFTKDKYTNYEKGNIIHQCSTFQCYIIIVYKFPLYNLGVYIDYKAIKDELIEYNLVHSNNSQPLYFNSEMYHTESYQQIFKFVTTQNHHVHLDIIKSNISTSNIMNCALGGIATIEKMRGIKNTVICGRTYRHLSDRGSIYSHGHVLYLVIYYYRPYSQISVSILASTTSCVLFYYSSLTDKIIFKKPVEVFATKIVNQKRKFQIHSTLVFPPTKCLILYKYIAQSA